MSGLYFPNFFLFEGGTHDQQTILSNLSNRYSDLFFR